MYDTRVRHTGYEEFLMPHNSSTSLTTVGSALSKEFVYSFRTGGRSNASHVTMPLSSGSVSSMTRDRARFYRDMSETFSANSAHRSSTAEKRFSKTDDGHLFSSFKRTETPCVMGYSRKSGPAVSGQARVCLSVGLQAPRSALVNFEDTAYTQLVPWESASTEQARLNGVFASMAPDRAKLDIGESVMALFLGQFPKAFKSLPELLQQIRVVAKKRPALSKAEFKNSSISDIAKTLPKGAKAQAATAGGDYLNYLFAWSPLVADVIKVIHGMIQVDQLAYGTSSRRTGVMTGPSGSVTWQDGAPLPSPLRLCAGNYLTASSGYGGISAAGLVPNGSHEFGQLFYNSDTRLSIRFVNHARPTSGANGFIDKAQAFLEDIGVISPSLWWELLPFSWLADWWTHLGSSIENATKFSSGSGLYPLDYAYATRVTRVLLTVRPKGRVTYATNWEFSFAPGSLSKSFMLSKERRRATPFGFGVDLSSLTGSQMTILIALGLAGAR